MWYRVKPALFAALFATSVAADADHVVESWQNWAGERSITEGQIVVFKDGQEEGRSALGGAAGPVDIASLSKAITGACLNRLVTAGQLSWGDSVGDFLPETQAPLDWQTLSELVTHGGGLWPDSTQGPMADWRGAGEPVYRDLIANIDDRPLRKARHRYNNENYGVIGAVVAAATGAPYAETCAKELNLKGSPSPLFGRFAAWGGWRMELSDYAHFFWSAFHDHDPTRAPAIDLGDGAQYGLGTVWREARGGGYNFWHFGALCFPDGPNFFTFTVLYANGWSAVTHVTGCPKEEWFGSLDQAIIKGVFR